MGKSQKAGIAGGSSGSKAAFARALHAVRLKKASNMHKVHQGPNKAVHTGSVVEKQAKPR